MTPPAPAVSAGGGLPSIVLEMRRTWDALAAGETAVYVGDPASGAEELAGLFGRLGADPRGGRCVEVGCGPGRMTGALAERFDEVVALDVSPAMLEQARGERAGDERPRSGAVSGERLDGVEDGSADALVCYLVLQHLPVGEGRPLVPVGVRPRARACRRGVRPDAGARREGRPRPAGDSHARSSALPGGPTTAPPSAATA